MAHNISSGCITWPSANYALRSSSGPAVPIHTDVTISEQALAPRSLIAREGDRHSASQPSPQLLGLWEKGQTDRLSKAPIGKVTQGLSPG